MKRAKVTFTRWIPLLRDVVKLLTIAVRTWAVIHSGTTV
jgi:hypothetical protein